MCSLIDSHFAIFAWVKVVTSGNFGAWYRCKRLDFFLFFRIKLRNFIFRPSDSVTSKIFKSYLREVASVQVADSQLPEDVVDN